MTICLCLWLVTSHATATDRRTPIVHAVELATPAVVTIEVEVGRSAQEGQEGSGVVIREDAVLTNAHVIQGARQVFVRLADGGRHPATVIARDYDIDLAVLRVMDAEPLVPIAVGDSGQLLLGETVIAIGNPLGLGMTVSTGVVASISRDVEIEPGLTQTFIQTDAAINPGNSGGALVDVNGRLIGINTAIRRDAEGIGFAIPVNRAMKIARDMLDYGNVRAPWLGVGLRDTNLRGPILVTGVVAEGPGRTAGLQEGDLVTAVDGHPIKSRSDLNARIAQQSPGDTIQLTVLRKRQTTEVEVLTEELPAEAPATLVRDVFGIELAMSRGQVKVSHVIADGAWTERGLAVGDVISTVDDTTTPRVEDVHLALRRAMSQHRDRVSIVVRRRGKVARHTLRLR